LADVFNLTLSTNLTLGVGKVLPLVFQQAEKCLDEAECINFENKVVLSIAIRLIAEDIMIRRIHDPALTNDIKENQTVELFKMFKKAFGSDRPAIALLDQVVLMTPEAIHLNSFMYEPILDLSDSHLKNLYKKVKDFAATASP